MANNNDLSFAKKKKMGADPIRTQKRKKWGQTPYAPASTRTEEPIAKLRTRLAERSDACRRQNRVPPFLRRFFAKISVEEHALGMYEITCCHAREKSFAITSLKTRGTALATLSGLVEKSSRDA